MHVHERSEGALRPADEFFEDPDELGFARDLVTERVALVQSFDPAREQGTLRGCSTQRRETIAKGAVHYRESMSPSPLNEPTHDELLHIYAQPKTIAVVGASDRAGKPAHDIPRYLKSQGYRIVPVNPNSAEVLGEHAFPSLREIDIPIDVVDVFRPARDAESVARDAIAIGAKVLWFQPGTDTDGAAAAATEAGLTVIRRRCMGVTHGLLGLGPGPHATD